MFLSYDISIQRTMENKQVKLSKEHELNSTCCLGPAHDFTINRIESN